MGETLIEWTDKTWNPVRGCSLVSPGCENCYAMKQAHRFSGKGAPYEGLTVLSKHGPRWTGRAREVPEMLAQPLRWRKPARIFVNSMSDLFHEDVSDAFIDRVFGVMAACRFIGRDPCPGHTFQVLTKRAERMADYLSTDRRQQWAQWATHYGGGYDPDGIYDQTVFGPRALPNVWLGVSVEDQKRADERIPRLLSVPASVRFLSCEPLLQAIDLNRIDATKAGWRAVNGAAEPTAISAFGRWQEKPMRARLQNGVDWVIVGGESGPGSRRFHAGWARSIVKQCRDASVPVFVKQMGAVVIDRNDNFNTCGDTSDEEGWPLNDPDAVEEDIDGYRTEYQGAPVRIRLRDKKGGDMSEWPPNLRVREFPAVQR